MHFGRDDFVGGDAPHGLCFIFHFGVLTVNGP